MKRLGRQFEVITSVENLWHAWLDFRRGKRGRPTVIRFEPHAMRHILRLERALKAETYRPEGYRLKLIHDPKVRLIAAAPVRDRVVHHAIYRVLSPRLDTSLVPTTFACLPGRGTHRAVLAFQRALRRYRWVLHLDIARYFISIDRSILMALMARKLKDPRVLSLLARIAHRGADFYQRPEVIEALQLPPGVPGPGCGLPIGNLTSQWWANHYLSGLDHYLVRDLKLPYAQRYMDDITLFHSCRRSLERARSACAAWLAEHRALVLKNPEAPVRSARASFTYLGYRVHREHISVAQARLRRAERRLAHAARHGGPERVARALASYKGWVTFPATNLSDI